MARQIRPVPKWARHQIVAAYICLLASIGMFVAAGIGWEPFGKRVDFGVLPLALLLISGWVLFQLNIVRLLRGLEAGAESPEDKGVS